MIRVKKIFKLLNQIQSVLLETIHQSKKFCVTNTISREEENIKINISMKICFLLGYV